MGAWISTAGRSRRHTRWRRRIAGVVGTGALIAVAVAIAVMVLPGSKSSPGTSAANTPRSTPSPSSHAGKNAPTALTAAQKRARSAAVATLKSQGYEPVRLSDYNPSHSLRVLVGRRTGDPQKPKRAFFFAGGHYVGSDSTAPSTGLKVAGSGNHWVTLSYAVYSPGATAPSEHVKVRFALSGGALTAVGGTIPAASERLAGT